MGRYVNSFGRVTRYSERLGVGRYEPPRNGKKLLLGNAIHGNHMS